MRTKFESSSGDVFRDLGFSDAESEDLRLRSDLLIELKKQIAARGESQTKIAQLLDVNQPRVSNLLKGRIDLFSLDALVEMLDKLGNRVDVTVRAKAERITLTVDAGILPNWASQPMAVSSLLTSMFEECETPKVQAADNQYVLAA